MKSEYARRSAICPQCGRKKDYRSALCQECGRKTNPGINFEALTPEWCFAFVGLFMGEGSVGIYFDPRARGSYHARGAIKLRADDLPMLNDIHEKLGGKIYPEGSRNRSNPVMAWATSDTAHVLGLCDLIIEYNILPAKKLGDIEIVKEFCEWRMAQPYRVTSWDCASELRDKLLRYREFRSPEGG